jgi:hypothetical protein
LIAAIQNLRILLAHQKPRKSAVGILPLTEPKARPQPALALLSNAYCPKTIRRTDLVHSILLCHC